MTRVTMKEITSLRKLTGSSTYHCKKALEYSKGDFDLAIAYLRAIGLPVRTRGMSFDERVKLFLQKEDD